VTKGEHIISCPRKPTTWFKKAGTLWVCRECGQWWIIDESNWCGDAVKTWEKVPDGFIGK